MCILQQQFNLGKMEYKLCVGESQAFFYSGHLPQLM